MIRTTQWVFGLTLVVLACVTPRSRAGPSSTPTPPGIRISEFPDDHALIQKLCDFIACMADPAAQKAMDTAKGAKDIYIVDGDDSMANSDLQVVVLARGHLCHSNELYAKAVLTHEAVHLLQSMTLQKARVGATTSGHETAALDLETAYLFYKEVVAVTVTVQYLRQTFDDSSDRDEAEMAQSDYGKAQVEGLKFYIKLAESAGPTADQEGIIERFEACIDKFEDLVE